MSSAAEAYSICDWPPARKFTRAEVIKLIRLYKKNPCLWNVKSKDYTRTGMKKRAYEEMAQTLNVSISEIKRKIRSIRNTYLIEKKKVDESLSGCSAKDIYEPKLAWFEEMSFLDESILLRRKIITSAAEESAKPSTSIAQEQVREEQASLSEPLPPHRSRKRDRSTKIKSQKPRKPHKNNITRRILKFMKQEEDDTFSAFGKSIALQLKNLPKIESCQAMREIQAITTAYTVNYISRTNGPASNGSSN